MSWEEKLRKTSESTLGYLEGYQQKLVAEREGRREYRRHRILVVDRVMALLLDVVLVFLIFQSALLAHSHYTLIFAGVLTKVMQDPNFTLVQAFALMASEGILRIWLAMCLTQFVLVGLIVLPCLYFMSATPGMLVLRLRLRKLDRKTRPTLWQYIRFFLVGCVLIPPGMLSLIAMKIRRDGRALHDVAAGVVMLRTRTIEAEKQAALAEADAVAEAKLEVTEKDAQEEK